MDLKQLSGVSLNECASLDELWNLHEEVIAELTRKITLEKAKLDERLRKIKATSIDNQSVHRERRPSAGPCQIPQSKQYKGDLGGPWQATTLVGGSAQVGQEVGSVFDTTILRQHFHSKRKE